MIQYTEYTSIPQAVRDVVANKISLLDSYILMQTGENEFTALVNKPGLNECRQYTFTRTIPKQHRINTKGRNCPKDTATICIFYSPFHYHLPADERLPKCYTSAYWIRKGHKNGT